MNAGNARLCLNDLEALSSERDAGKRRELLRRITDLYFMTEKQQSETDRSMFGGVMKRVAGQLEMEARMELAERLCAAKSAPHNIVRSLACDNDIEVARPVLENSEVLTDEDLVDIASSHGQDHLMAMSRREVLSSTVTDVIVKRGNDEVLTAVSANGGASFSDSGFQTLASRAVAVEELRQNLVERDDVPRKMIEKIKHEVAERLKREFMNGDGGISASEIEQVVEMQAGNADFSGLARDGSLGELKIDVADLHQKGLLSEDKLREFAEKGMRAEIVHSLALKTGIDVEMARHVLYEAEVPALGVLCRANHFKRDTFAALLQERIKNSKMPADLVIKAMRRYDSLSYETAQRIFRFLKVRLSISSSAAG